MEFSIAEMIPKWLPHQANSSRILCLMNLQFANLDQLQGALYILQNSPNLEQLEVINMNPALENMHLDVQPTLSYLEATNCLDQTLDRLKTINIFRVEISRPLLLFIKLLLDRSPTLEKISITPSLTADANEKYNFAKDVMLFPRASSKAELHYLDP
ncbi:uncharacterized protein [Rutidosis leptorrhynchoides]|uniref:uncharacterized protein isoform X2 n=1 Tax=Rutidosis leptorrhynchoides TaxID=125765 RepID=UPI003A991AFE